MDEGMINQEELGRYVDRIEKLHDERKVLNTTIGAVYEEAKAAGFQTPILRQIVKERQLEPEVRHDQYALLNAYRDALGMLAGTPLGEAAMERAEGETANGTMTKPRSFTEQPLHGARPGRGRPRKVPFDQEHPQGTA